MTETQAFVAGWEHGLDEAINLLRDYADEARKDKRYQAANYLSAAVHKLLRRKVEPVK